MQAQIHPDAKIGHVHLKVSDLERAVRFYSEVLGFELQTRYGSDAAFLSAGGYHHHIGLNVWHSKGAGPAPVNSAGLYHFAIVFPDRTALATTVKRILDNGWPLDGAADHLVSEAVYLRDPDGNGIELYRDRPRDEWPHNDDGSLAMATLPLDLGDLLSGVGDGAG
ncbi:MAG TPA: VOC family protein [Actinomycetota bacterium]|nr:VOC family protein [Actinomycetota bacterium]